MHRQESILTSSNSFGKKKTKTKPKTHSGKNTLLLNEKQAAFPDQSHLGKLGNTATDTVPTIFTKLCLQQIWTTGM